MDPLIATPASCEVRGVIRLLQAEGHSAAEIQFCEGLVQEIQGWAHRCA
jgi:hypothetical protein